MTTVRRQILVTGGGRGLGRRIVLHLAARGHAVSLMGRSVPESADATLREAAAGFIEVDLSDNPSLDGVLQGFSAGDPVFDVVIAAAGIRSPGRPLVECTPDEVREIVQVNLVAPALLARAAIPGMVRRGYGRLILIGSRAGLRGAAGEAAYGASKAGLVSITESLSREVDGRTVTVNAICPETFSRADGTDTRHGSWIVDRVLREVDGVIDGSDHGRVIPVETWQHRFKDFGRHVVRAARLLGPGR